MKKEDIQDKKIFFFSWGQLEGESSNMGDKALFISIIDELKKINPKSVITISNDILSTKKNYGIDAISYKNPLSIVNVVYRSDLIILGGGEYIQDKSSFFYLIFNLFVPFLCKIFNKPVFAWGIGVGSFDELSKVGSCLTYIVFKNYKLITVRDHKSKNNLIGIGLKEENIKVTADSALLLKKSQTSEELPKKFIVLCLRDVFLRNKSLLPISIKKRFKLYSKSYLENRSSFIVKITKYIDYIISELDIHVVLLPIYTGKTFSLRDDLFSIGLKKHLENPSKATVIEKNQSPNEVIDILGKAKFVVSVPLHGLILSTVSSTPMISLTYSSKNEEFLRRISMQKFSLDIYSFKLEELKDLTNDILDNHDYYVKKLFDVYSQLYKQSVSNLDYLLDLTEEINK